MILSDIPKIGSDAIDMFDAVISMTEISDELFMTLVKIYFTSLKN